MHEISHTTYKAGTHSERCKMDLTWLARDSLKSKKWLDYVAFYVIFSVCNVHLFLMFESCHCWFLSSRVTESDLLSAESTVPKGRMYLGAKAGHS